MAVCTKCGIEKPEDAFLFRKDRNKRSTVCRVCTNSRLLALLRNNPGRAAKYHQNYKQNNPDGYRARTKRANDKRYGTPRGRLEAVVRNAVYRSLAGTRKQKPTYEALGYSVEDLMTHLERQFLPGMKWDNYGEWHVDHIVPLAEFDISGTDSHEFKAAWALTNLRPLWGKDNVRKQAKALYLI